MSASALTIDVISDVVCLVVLYRQAVPGAGDRVQSRHPGRGALPALFPEPPGVPPGGISREEYLITKFGSVERYNSNNTRVVEAAAAAGLSYNRDRIKHQPNTLDCHRLILWAGRAGKAAAMKQRLMELYFSEGGDLTSTDVLFGAAADCGLDGEEVRALLASRQDVEEVEHAAESAKEAGIDGVPYFIIGGMIALSASAAARLPCRRHRTRRRRAGRGGRIAHAQRPTPQRSMIARSAPRSRAARSPQSRSRAPAHRCCQSRAMRLRLRPAARARWWRRDRSGSA